MVLFVWPSMMGLSDCAADIKNAYIRRNSDVVQKLVVQLSCNSKMTHSRVHVGM